MGDRMEGRGERREGGEGERVEREEVRGVG